MVYYCDSVIEKELLPDIHHISDNISFSSRTEYQCIADVILVSCIISLELHKEYLNLVKLKVLAFL